MTAAELAAGRLWTLQRFGLTPQKVARRVVNRAEPKILCICIPKAGTHLLERALCLHPRLYRKLLPTINPRNVSRWGGLRPLLRRVRPGQILMTHLLYEVGYPEAARRAGVRSAFLIRDPRDVVVSQTHFISSTPDHRMHQLYRSLPRFKDRLLVSIRGHDAPHAYSIREILDGFAPWLDEADAVLRFEDLIGSAGGGNDQRQLDALHTLFKNLEVDADEAFLSGVGGRLFSSSSPTFRRGSIGQWREHFDAEVSEAFASVAGEGLARYGYEEEGAG